MFYVSQSAQLPKPDRVPSKSKMYLRNSFMTLKAFLMWEGLTVTVRCSFSSSAASEERELCLMLKTGTKKKRSRKFDSMAL